MNRIIPVLILAAGLSGISCAKNNMELFTGHWEGVIPAGGIEIIIGLDVPGEQGISFSIPEQALAFMPVERFSGSGKEVSFQVPAGADLLRFQGALADENTIEGKYMQTGFTGTFTLKKIAPTPFRKTETEPPFNGIEEPVAIKLPEGTLHGTLCRPAEVKTETAVLLVPGSGPTDRDGNSALQQGKNNSLKMVSRFLAENGYVTLRYDKRGIGENTWAGFSEETLRFEHFIDDMVRWVDFLKTETGVKKVICCGHSQGALVAIEAVLSGKAEGLITMAGTGRPISDIMIEQLSRQPINIETVKSIFESLRKGETVELTDPTLAPLFRKSVQPFMISWVKYDPADSISRITVPALIIQGEQDVQTSATDARLLLQGALRANTQQAGILLIENMNHVLKEVHTRYANYLSYVDPGYPLPGELKEGLLNFLKKYF